MKRLLAIAAGGAILLWMAWSSFVTIENDQLGVIERFGRADRDLLPGLHLKAPWPIETVVKTSGSQASLRMPIGYRIVDERAGVRPPERMKHWLTGDSNIIELRANVLYRVADVRDWLYGVSRVRDDRGDLESREFALRRLAESALTRLVSEVSIDDILAGGTIVLEEDAKSLIQEDVDELGLGVEINALQIVKSDPLASVKDAFRAVTDAKSRAGQSEKTARSEQARAISRAKVDARRTVERARADAESMIRSAEGRAAAFLALSADVRSIDSLAAWRLRAQEIGEILESVRIRTVPRGPFYYFSDGDGGR